MHGNLMSLLLPLLFIAHNIEEFRGYTLINTYFLKHAWKKFRDREVYKFAVSFLSCIVALIVGMNFFIENRVLEIVTLLILLSIFLNGIFHVLISIYYRKIIPGAITAFFLIIPYSIMMLMLESVKVVLFSISLPLILVLTFITMIGSVYLGLFFGLLLKLTLIKARRKK